MSIEKKDVSPEKEKIIPGKEKGAEDNYLKRNVETANQSTKQLVEQILEVEDTDENIRKISAVDLLTKENEKDNEGLLGALFAQKEIPLAEKEKSAFQRLRFRGQYQNVMQEWSPGTTIDIDFRGNRDAFWKIGAGDILPTEIRIIAVIDTAGKERIGTRRSSPRPGYYDEKGYIPIFTGYKIHIPTTAEIEKHEQAEKLEPNTEIYLTDSTKLEDLKEEEKLTRTEFIADLKSGKEKSFDSYAEYLKPEFKLELKKEDLENGAAKEELWKLAKEITALKTWTKEIKRWDLNQNDLEEAYRILEAIGEQESRGNYSALGALIENGVHRGTRALGKYQIMPRNWREWGQNFEQLKDFKQQFENDTLIPTAPNQDFLAFSKILEYYQFYKNLGRGEEEIVQLVATRWYGNMEKGVPKKIEQISRQAPSLGPSPLAYSQEVLNRYSV